MKQLIVLLTLILAGHYASAQEKQVPDTMTIKKFAQLDSGKYFFIYSESPKDSLHLGLDQRLKCPACPTCPPPLPERFLVSLTIDPKTGQGIATYNTGSPSTITLTSIIIIK